MPLRPSSPAHTSVSLPAAANAKNAECYLGLLYTMDDVAVYGYMTPVKMKMVLALALSDAVVRDADVTAVCLYKKVTIHPPLPKECLDL
jgi:trafficking protein particle complex subunit 2